MKVAFICLLSFFTLKCFSQQSLNLGLIYGQRLNYRQPSFNNVLGASIEITLPLSLNRTHIRFTTGIEGTEPTVLANNGLPAYYDGYTVIPVRAGLQKYVYHDQGFVFAEPGVAIGFFPHDRTGETDTKINLSYAIGGGYKFQLNDKKYIQASLNFNKNPYGSLYKFSWISLRVAYGLNWGNKL